MTVSILSLLAEGDGRGAAPVRDGRGFNPLPPCGGRLL